MATVLKIKCKGCGKTAKVTLAQADAGQAPVLTCKCNAGSKVVSLQTFSASDTEE